DPQRSLELPEPAAGIEHGEDDRACGQRRDEPDIGPLGVPVLRGEAADIGGRRLFTDTHPSSLDTARVRGNPPWRGFGRRVIPLVAEGYRTCHPRGYSRG